MSKTHFTQNEYVVTLQKQRFQQLLSYMISWWSFDIWQSFICNGVQYWANFSNMKKLWNMGKLLFDIVKTP